MKRAAIYSAILHVIIFIMLTVGFYNPFRKTLDQQKPLMIEFVNISDVSMAPVLAPEEMLDPEPIQDVIPEEQPPLEQPQPQPEPKPEPKPEVKPEAAPEPKPEPKPEVKPEAAPEPAKPETKPEPAPAPEAVPVPAEKPIEPKKEAPKPEPKKEEIQPQKPKPEEKPKADKVEVNLDKKEDKPKPKEIDKKEKKKIDDDFANLLNETAPKKKDKDKAKSDGKVKGAPADKIGEVVTANEIDAIRQRISRCWIVPNGARGARDMIVDVDMKIGKDGTVLDAKIADKARMASDPAFRAAAESARRAVMDPNCNPLPLNPEKFEQWKELTLSFNPKDMY